jgi:anti-sigma B factor antagonist
MTSHVGDAGAPLVPSGWWVMGVTVCVRPGDYGTVVAVSGEIDVCLEGPLQLVLLRIMRERGATLLLDLSGVSFMDCAGLRAVSATRRRAELRGGFVRLTAVSAAVGRIIDLTGTREGPSAAKRSSTDRSAQVLLNRTGRIRRADESATPRRSSGSPPTAIASCPRAIA